VEKSLRLFGKWIHEKSQPAELPQFSEPLAFHDWTLLDLALTCHLYVALLARANAAFDGLVRWNKSPDDHEIRFQLNSSVDQFFGRLGQSLYAWPLGHIVRSLDEDPQRGQS
jgi:hypothetical protein